MLSRTKSGSLGIKFAKICVLRDEEVRYGCSWVSIGAMNIWLYAVKLAWENGIFFIDIKELPHRVSFHFPVAFVQVLAAWAAQDQLVQSCTQYLCMWQVATKAAFVCKSDSRSAAFLLDVKLFCVTLPIAVLHQSYTTLAQIQIMRSCSSL